MKIVSYNILGGIGWVLSMTLIGYGLATTWPGVTKHIEKLINGRLLQMAGARSGPAQAGPHGEAGISLEEIA